MAERIKSDLYNWSKKPIDCFRHLEENLYSLRDKMKDLKDLSEDVKRRVEVIEEEGRMRRTNQVNSWLQRVEVMDTQVNKILERGPQEIRNKSLSNCRSTYRFGKLVIEKLDAVNQLMDRGRFDVVADRLPRALVEEKPMEKTVGLDSTFEKVWNWLRDDDDVGIIGLYGTGGVGKTTLLKKINNEFLRISLDFDVVIWAEVSKDANAERVQDQILERLGKSTTASRDVKATEITRALSGKKFVLLLDDLWKRFDLLQVGVPLPDNQNKSKVVFTTRSEDVCGYMEANKKIRVEYLPRKEAWELFQRKVGEDTLNLHPEIPELAMIAAEECGGLPVALITIGRAMASRKTPREWKQALEVLKNNPSKFAGIGDEVFPLLKFSYDSLLNDTVRSCFIYCSLFLGLIWNEQLVGLWIGEGFLDEFDDIKEARNKGHEIIESLKLACLLETADWVLPYVRMHDVIRDMAVWIACECGRKTGKFLTGDRLIEESATSKWKEAERTSLWSDAIEKLSEIPICPNLLTLLAHQNLKVFPCGFFQFMHALRVLDLSGNSNLTELPVEISGLVSLQYLDLTLTKIRKLPIWFKNLVNLKILRLLGTFELVIIPEQVISSLSMLQSLNMAWSSYKYQTLDGNVLSGGNEALLAELESLEHLQHIRITIKSAPAFRMLSSSQKLRSCTNGLFLTFCEGLTSLPLSCLKDMKHLEILWIDSCVDLKEMAADLVEKRRKGLAHDDIQRPKIMRDGYFNNLTDVTLSGCDNISHLTWLIFTPNLQRLVIRKCKSVKEVISDHDNDGRVAEFGGNSSIFPSLEFLALYELTELKSIYGHALPFPSLRWIYIKSCPMLRKLPLDSNSAKNCLKHILIEKQEYDALEWDDEANRLHFLPYIRQPWRREESDVMIPITGMPSSAPTSIFSSREGWMGLPLITWGLQGTSLFLLTRNIAGAQSTDVEVAILNYGTTNIAGAQYTQCAYAQYTRYTMILLERGSWLVGSGFEFELL